MNSLFVLWFNWILIVFNSISTNAQAIPPDRSEEAAQSFISAINAESELLYNAHVKAVWTYNTNITDHNQQLMLNSTAKVGAYDKEKWENILEWKDYWPNFKDPLLRRQFEESKVLGDAALPKQKFDRLSEIVSEMQQLYSTGKVCDFRNSSKCDLSLQPEIVTILEKSRDLDELEHIWTSWRNVVGKPMKKLYSEFVTLSNEAAKINGYATTSDLWIGFYESESFEGDVSKLYDQLAPLYKQLHAYARRHLRKLYGESVVSARGPIPAHIVGNMWAQEWESLFDIMTPYPSHSAVDVTETMKQQNMTVRKMFEMADDFFASLNLSRVEESFWQNSMIEKPKNREVVCHASAWDFSDRNDFRIKQCTKIAMKDFAIVHHELGHIQYYMQYRHLPLPLRDGANSGFHEAVGDLMSLSVLTPKHLYKVGLLDELATSYESDINFLLRTALRAVAFLPFGFLVDKWRWEMFRGRIEPHEYTCQWWNMRYKYQGVTPPVPRMEDDFDPGAKFHIAINDQYIDYFVAYILQFQFHKSLCLLAGEYEENNPQKPLHKCDIYQSTQAGNALGDLLKLGSSQHWSQTLESLTGTQKMDASALREYFQPLEQWLTEDNAKHGEFIGWEGEQDFCGRSSVVPISTSEGRGNSKGSKDLATLLDDFSKN